MQVEIAMDIGECHGADSRPETPPTPPPSPLVTAECFVCTDAVPLPWRSDCKCTDRHVHGDCLLKLLSRRSEPNCPVCLEVYGNVVVTHVRSLRCLSMCRFVCLLVVLLLTMGGCALNTWLGLLDPNRSPRTTTVLVVSAILISIVFCVGAGILIVAVRQCGMEATAGSCVRTRRVLAVIHPDRRPPLI